MSFSHRDDLAWNFAQNHAPRLQKVHFQLMSVAQKCCCSNSLIVGEVFAAIGRGESFDQKTLFEVTYRSFNCSMISYTSLHGGKLHIDNVQQWETVICSWSAITCCVWCFINKGRGRGEVTSTLGPLTLQNTVYWSSSTVKLRFPWLLVGSQRIAEALYIFFWNTQIYWKKRKRLHKRRVQLPQDW